MACIDFNAFNAPRPTELYDAPIMTGRTFTAAFPAIHPFSVIVIFVGDENGVCRRNQSRLVCEKIVRRVNNVAAETRLRQIGKLGEGICHIRCFIILAPLPTI